MGLLPSAPKADASAISPPRHSAKYSRKFLECWVVSLPFLTGCSSSRRQAEAFSCPLLLPPYAFELLHDLHWLP